MVGAEVFKQQADAAEKSMKDLGSSAEAAAPKAKKAGDGVDELGKKAKAAAPAVDQTAKAAKGLGDESAKSDPKVKQVTKSVEQLRAESNQARNTVGTAFVGIGAAIAAAAAISVAKFADFDDGLSNVRASTRASASEMDDLGDAAIEAGADTAFSARESADAQDELAKAGITVSQILGGSLRGSLSLAAAGELEVARAAEIAATTLKVFNLEADQTEHVADLLSAGAGKAQGSVDDLSLALEYSGIQLAQFKVPLEESVGTLALFAANGILGEKAGTGLRGVLASLTSPAAIGARTMKEYGINVFDAQGKFIGMAGVAGQLDAAFSDLTEAERSAALGRIFGNESLNVANVLYKSGAAGVREWTGLVDDAGYAAQTAAIRQDNLAGDVEKLGGAFDSAFVRTGATANDVLREMTQIVTFLIDSYGSLDPTVQGTALALSVGAAAVLLLTGTVFLAIPKVAEFKLALDTLGTSVGKLAVVGGVATVVITAIVAVLAAVAGANADAAAKTAAYGDTLDKTTNKMTNSSRELAKQNLATEASFGFIKSDSTYDAATKLGIGLDVVTDAALGNAEALAEVQDAMSFGAVGSAKYEAALERTGLTSTELSLAIAQVDSGVRGESASLEEAIRIAEQKQAVDHRSIDITDNATDSYGNFETTVDGVVSSIQDLAAELDALNGKNLDARDAARQLEAAYDDFDAAIAENGATLDLNTAAGRDNEAALDAIAQAALDSGQAITDAGGGYEEYRASLEGSRQALLDRIADLGITGSAAEDLADTILRIPAETEWKLYAEMDAAQQQIDRFITLNNGRRITLTGSLDLDNRIRAQVGASLVQADGGVVNYYANGGVEHHVAQIASAGTMRVWAEPETGGEAYIPLAQAKRGRSTAILANVANEFGYQLVPASAQSFADGGRSGGTPTSPSPIAVRVINNSSVRLSDLIRMEIMQQDEWAAVDLSGGVNP